MSRRAAPAKRRSSAPAAPLVASARPARVRAGARVVVTDGLSRGLVGDVTGRAEVMFGDMPMWLVDLGELLGVRAIREDYLREVTNG